MKRRILFGGILLWMVVLFMPRMAWAFYCNSGGTTYSISEASVPRKSTDAAYTSSTYTNTCHGNATFGEYDALRIQNLTVPAAFTSQNYVVELSLGGGGWTTAVGQQIWGWANSGAISNIRMRIRRTSDAALTASIPAGTTISIQVNQRSNGNWGYHTFTLYYKLDKEISAIVPTCDVKDFDNKVLLPIVKITDLIANGAGRYAKAKKPFTINLECTDSPKVSVTFTGTIMDSNDEVLKNLESNNPNVGIQLEYVDNYSTTKTTVKNGTAFQVLQSAGTNETLNFNSYYYYKGGGSAVSGGLVKSNAEFLFTYQ